MTPTGNKIIIEPESINKEEKSETGIFLQKNSSNSSVLSGKVLSIGMETKEVHPNDIVYYELHASHTVNIKGKDYVIVQESNIIGYERGDRNNIKQSINEDKQ